MANTRTYLNHLLQNTGITPACSEEERAAAEVISKIFSDHGFAPEMQEFTSSSSNKVVHAAMGVVLFVSVVLMGISGVLGGIGFILAVAIAVVYTLERVGKLKLPQVGNGGLSQNVIAYHKASGPLASPRNRPVVVVAHYDSPRADLLSREPFSGYRAIINKLLPIAMVLPAIVAVLRLLPLPGAVKVLLWIVGIAFSLVPLLCAVSSIMNRHVLSYTTGAVCNKSSVAAMLGVMDAVSPASVDNEFSGDVPFEEYMDGLRQQYQSAYTAEGAATADAAGAGDASLPYKPSSYLSPDAAAAPVAPASQNASGSYVDDMFGAPVEEDAEPVAAEYGFEPAAEPEPVAAEAPVEEPAFVDETPVEDDEPGLPVNAAGFLRYGEGIVRELGMLPVECELVYEAPVEVPGEAPAPIEAEQVASEVSVVETIVAPADEASAADPFMVDETEDTAVAEALAEDAAAVASVPVVAPVPVPEPAPAVVPVVPVMNQAPAQDFEELDGDIDDDLVVPAVVDELVNAPEELLDVHDEVPETVDAPAAMPAAPVPGEVAAEQDDVAAAEATLADENPSETSVLEAMPEDMVLDEPVPAAPVEAYEEMPEQVDEPVLSGIEDFEEIIPSDDMEIIPAAFEELEVVDEGVPAASEEPAEAVDAAAADGETAGEDEPELQAEAAAEPEEDEPVAESAPEPDSTVSFDAVEFDEQAAPVEGADNTVASTQVFEAPIEKTGVWGTQTIPTQRQGAVDAPVSQTASFDVPVSQPAPAAARPQRQINIPSIGSSPSSTMANQIPAVTPVVPAARSNRSALFDLPDPSAAPSDPFGTSSQPRTSSASTSGFVVFNSDDVIPMDEPQQMATAAPVPVEKPAKKKRRGLFGRKKKEESSMSDWLGVDEDFDAKRSGRDIGSWDNFEGDDGWKGGAVGDGSEEELRQAVTSMGDDELLGHDIWFVATGSSENDNAGMRAFLDAHRDKLRGVFMINLECVGAGQLAMLSVEGSNKTFKGDKRIMRLFSHVSTDFHRPLPTVEMPYVDTDAHVAMERSLRAMTLAGVDGSGFACSHTEDDQPINLNTENIQFAADVVTEVIRRS